MVHEFICRQCNQFKRYESPVSGGPTGYGKDAQGNKICFACCGPLDQGQMLREGHATLYLTGDDQGNHFVTNWPNSLRFKVGHLRVGRHNMTGKRFDVWFNGPDNRVWHGVQYGQNTQLCHVRRTREMAR